MTIRGWKTRYREIRNVFGYRKYDDLISAKKLNSKIGKRYPLSNIKKTIRGQTVFIIGAGPSLSRSISTLKKYQNITKIVADGAVQALIEHKIKPQILVTDLDGDIASIKKIGRTKIPIIIHAHGNNYDKLDIVSKLQNKIGTTQTEKFGKLENFGGFTDGDRCVFLAESFNAKKPTITGYQRVKIRIITTIDNDNVNSTPCKLSNPASVPSVITNPPGINDATPIIMDVA